MRFKRFARSLMPGAVALLAACDNGGTSGSSANVSPLAAGTASLVTPYQSVVFAKNGVPGSTLNLTYGYGSAAFHDPKDPATDVWTVGDRGPNFGCSDKNKAGALYTGIDDFCTKADGSVDPDGVVFPTPGYIATLNHIRIEKDAQGALTVRVLEQIGLHDGHGRYVTGVSNPYAENPYDATGSPIPFDADGLDLEGLARLPDGSFWLSEEYAPSLVHVGADGTVLERVVPAGVKAQLSNATYPITEGLPAILFKRKLNRGIENLGLAPDGKTLYFALQSPLANPDNNAYKKSRNVRFFSAALKSDGSFDKVTHEYVLLLDTPDLFTQDSGAKQNDVKLSELTVLPDGRPVIDERVTQTTKLERIDFSKATDILGGKWDDPATSPTLEQTDLSSVAAQTAAGVVPTAQTVVFDSAVDKPDLIGKIEGVALLDATYVLLTNDNDFGIDGDPSQFVVLPIAAQLAK
ncbi:MAG: esterase-like activity of phytase family protein [Isosphaeraceae bacterium]|nr:esterase-like activity of phytase family protein [Isosphaeraceae bacterium]